MWVSKLTTCLLFPTLAMVSTAATHAYVPASALRRSSGESNIGSLSNQRHGFRSVSKVPRKTALKTAEEAADEIPRGGGVNVAKDEPPPLPTMADFQKFVIPCLGLWIAQPLLSLVDTAFIGLSAAVPAESAAQLASLGPATTFFDGATYLFAFLNVATTNLYSTARAQRGEQSDEAEAVVRTASRVATKCGIGIMLFLMAFARPLLGLYIDFFWGFGIICTVLGHILFCPHLYIYVCLTCN